MTNLDTVTKSVHVTVIQEIYEDHLPCRRSYRDTTSGNNSIEFRYFIWNRHEKCIRLSTNKLQELLVNTLPVFVNGGNQYIIIIMKMYYMGTQVMENSHLLRHENNLGG